jgi:hypothetical protein
MNYQRFSRARLTSSAGSQGTARVLGAVPFGDPAARESRIDLELRTLVRPGQGFSITGRRKVQPNPRLKLAACGRRLRRKAQGKLFILSAASASRSLSAIR